MKRLLRPKVDMTEFEKFGFKKCNNIDKNHDCYYLCISRGVKMIFISPFIYDINDWVDDDPRIHERPNCKYRDPRTALDITYELIKADMLEMIPG